MLVYVCMYQPYTTRKAYNETSPLSCINEVANKETKSTQLSEDYNHYQIENQVDCTKNGVKKEKEKKKNRSIKAEHIDIERCFINATLVLCRSFLSRPAIVFITI